MPRSRAWIAIPLLALLAAGCFEPSDRRPGLWLSGEVVQKPVLNWDFTKEHNEIFIETQTPWLVPHSVTIVCTTLGDQLYVGAREPDGKRWVDNVDRDPRVRLKIGDRIYEGRLEAVTRPLEKESVYTAYSEKYGWPPVAPDQRPELRYWRVAEPG